jgi:hypothetical protein
MRSPICRHGFTEETVVHRSPMAMVALLGGLGLVIGALISAPLTGASTSAKPHASKNPPLISLQKQSSPRVGSTLAAPLDGASASLWSGAPKLSVQWYRCGTSTSCRAIPGATKDDYTVATADIGDFLQASVTAVNSAGSTVVKSPLSVVIRNPLAPTNTEIPEISPVGIAPLPGGGLHATTGKWTGSPTNYFFQWLACASSDKCHDIETGVVSLQTSSTYITSTADLGDTIKVEVLASNKYGPAPYATSRATEPVAF